MEWLCSYHAKTHHPSGRQLVLEGHFEGGGDVRGKLEVALRKRLRKPWLWYGVGVTVITPLGQDVDFLIEEEAAGAKIEPLASSHRFYGVNPRA